MSAELQKIRDGFLGLAYPERCRLCGSSVESWDDGVACSRCWNDPDITILFRSNGCDKCGTALALPATTTAQLRSCGLCATAPFQSARACGAYRGALEATILNLKITPRLNPRIKEIIRQTLLRNPMLLKIDLVIPVPLHRARLRARGFNQAAIIAQYIADDLGLSFDEGSLSRTRHTDPHRAGMDAADRARSVRDAFEVVRPRLVAGSSVLLIDDVYTTGSTIGSATRKLLDAGARSVNVLTIARVTFR